MVDDSLQPCRIEVGSVAFCCSAWSSFGMGRLHCVVDALKLCSAVAQDGLRVPGAEMRKQTNKVTLRKNKQATVMFPVPTGQCHPLHEGGS